MLRAVARIFCLPAIIFSLWLTGCGSSAHQNEAVSPSPPTTPPAAIGGVPAAFFGMNQTHLEGCDNADLAFPFTNAPIGAFRAWATCKDQWPDLNPAPGIYHWAGLDTMLAAVNASGLDDVLIEIGRVPNWISSNPTDTLCDAANVNGELPGMCDPPIDLNSDGTGTDLTFRTFATALLSHISDASFLTNHAQVKYIEIFEEFHRSDTVGGVKTLTGTVNTAGTAVTWVSGDQFSTVAPMDIMVMGNTSYTVQSITDATDLVLTTTAGGQTGGAYTMSGCHNTVVTKANPAYGEPCSWRGTFAQMLRMLQDLRCIAKGVTTDPISATGQTCGSAGYAQIGVDPTLLVSVGNAGPGSRLNGLNVMANFLYCNQSPPTGSQCNWSASNPLGSEATDMIGGHVYFNSYIPEVVINWVVAQAALFSSADKAKPYFVGEGSWGNNNRVSDPGLQAAFVPRWYLSLWMTGVARRAYWDEWDGLTASGGSGQLWSPVLQSTPPGQCEIPNPAGGYYCTGAIAFSQTVNWLSGAKVTAFTCPGGCSNPTHGTFTFDITRPGGYQAEIVWDSSPTLSACSNATCGGTALTAAPSFSVTQWRDVGGNTHTGMPSAIGAAPIIMENMSLP